MSQVKTFEFLSYLMFFPIRKLIPQRLISAYHYILAVIATLVYGLPSEKLAVIGVTGTDGKTTVTNLIAEILEEAGYVVGLTSTANFKIGDLKWPNESKQTMQGRFEMQRLLRNMVNAGCEYAVIETSSEGIKQFRHVGINYDVAVFTNLTPEHIESHGSFRKYREAKEVLFKKVASSCKIGQKKFVVVNTDDENAEYFLKTGCERKIVYGIDKKALGGLPGIFAKDVCLSSNCTSFTVFSTNFSGKALVFEIKMKLIGRFNVYNALAAIAVAISQKVSREVIVRAFEKKIIPIPGRMEIIDSGQPFMVIVDYAHAPNALENAYKTVMPFVQGKLWSVLGSQGGGRDKRKRPIMGNLAGTYADRVVVTNEDPYDEDPKKIIGDVLEGVLQSGKKLNRDAFKFLDRKEAMKFVFKKARKGDVVLITGKGSETVMMGPGGKRIPWDDRGVVRRVLSTKR